ncbi:unnamed protein product [Zymoseptoria tritici ST99CH_3D1]|nr:unnamed protein product [Zymoseptoria tritici ST99CH_3D1]
MTDYSKLKVAELKDLIKERGIPGAGLKLKQSYVDALIAADVASGGGDDSVAAEEVKEDKEDVEVAPAEEAVDAEDEVVEDVKVADEASGNDQGGHATGTNGDAKVETPKPVATSADVGSDADSTNKRKRRSPTPPVRDESASKKLKTADEEPAPLIEDSATDAPDAMEVEQDIKDAMDIEPSKEATQVQGAVQTSTEQVSSTDADVHMEDLPSNSPSKHTKTRALYICNLVRPLQPSALREHLLSIATHESNDAPEIETFFLDRLRTHAFVLFSTLPAAIRVRSSIHNQVWPDEPQRKPLFADFIPEEQVQAWIDLESTRDGMTRWEVVYNPISDTDTDGPSVASLEEVSSNAARKPTTGAGEGMPNAPSGPRSQNPAMAPPQPSASPVPQSKSFNALDASFSSTTTKPKIYFVPVPDTLVESRLAALEDATREDWTEKGEAEEANYKEGEMRRYTFEDGSSLVDGGMDWGRFGMSAPRGGGMGGGGPRRDRRRGGGGGGGGGWRGGGGGGYGGREYGVGGYGGRGGGDGHRGYRGDSWRR